MPVWIIATICILLLAVVAMGQENRSMTIKTLSAIDQKTQSKDINIARLTSARLPNAIITNKGTYFVSASTVFIDGTNVNGIISRSFNKGKDWQITSFDYKMPKGFLYDNVNDAIFFINRVRAWRSIDDGKTFSEYSLVNAKNPLDSLYNEIRKKELTQAQSLLKKGRKPIRYAYELSFSANPSLGIQLTNGVLVMPFKACIRKWKALVGKYDKDGYPEIDRSRVKNILGVEADVNVLVYSRDYGKTWIQSPSTPIYNRDGTLCIIDESSIAEVEENRVMINARGGTESWLEQTAKGRRVLYQTNPATGISRENFTIEGFQFDEISDGVLWDPLVHAAFAKCEYNGIPFWLFCNCYLPGEYRPRNNLMLQVSADGHHWTPVMLVSPAGKEINGYCSIYCNNNEIILSYEDGGSEGIKVINLTETCIDRIMEAYEENTNMNNLTVPSKKKSQSLLFRLLGLITKK